MLSSSPRQPPTKPTRQLRQPPIEDQTDLPKVTAKQPATVAKQAHARSAAKPTGSGVGLAITATVVIILSLAAMAVYAYLQTKK